MIRVMATRGEFIVAILAPIITALGFYLPLRIVMKFHGIDYAQFVMAVVILQAMSFTMISTALTAALQARSGFTTRLRTMPVAPLVPVAARAASSFARSVCSLTATISFGYLIGFRLHAGLAQSTLLCVFALSVGVVLSLGADALGTLSKRPEAVSQALTLPTLIFGMLSTGFVPETSFPEWIRPFARNQPISHFAGAMRDMAGSGVTFHALWPALAWLACLALFMVPLALWANLRQE